MFQIKKLTIAKHKYVKMLTGNIRISADLARKSKFQITFEYLKGNSFPITPLNELTV